MRVRPRKKGEEMGDRQTEIDRGMEKLTLTICNSFEKVVRKYTSRRISQLVNRKPHGTSARLINSITTEHYPTTPGFTDTYANPEKTCTRDLITPHGYKPQ